MSKQLLLLAISMASGWAQQTGNAPQAGAKNDLFASVVRVVHVRHVLPSTLQNLIRPNLPGNVTADDSLRILVFSTKPDQAAAMEQLIKDLDVPTAAKTPPTRNIELTFYFVLASQAPSTNARVDGGLEPVIKQLRAAFPYQSYQAIDSVFQRCRELEKVEATGAVGSRSAGDEKALPPPSVYQLRYRLGHVEGEGSPKLLRLEDLRFNYRVPVPSSPGSAQFTFYDTQVYTTAIDFREGQKIVVGKSSTGMADTALFLVMSARVVE